MIQDFATIAWQSRESSPSAKRVLSLIAYWRSSLVSRSYGAVRPPADFDPIVPGVRTESGDAVGRHWQCFGLDGFRQGIPPAAFAAAVFARSDARIDAINQRRAAMKPPRAPLEYPNEFVAECSPFSVTGVVAGRNPVRELPVFASVVVSRQTRSGPYRLIPGITQPGSPPPVWLSRRHFADSAYGSRTVRFGPFGTYLEFVGRASWLVGSWADLMGFLDGSWIVATGQNLDATLAQLGAVGIRVQPGWIREGSSDVASVGLIRQFDDLREWIAMDNDAPALTTLCTGESDVSISAALLRKSFLVGHVGATALADSQRGCAAAVRALPRGAIQSVNGPPGTGKTTLLRSVLADLVVRNVLDGKEPPLVLATAATNQAVTNIIEAFGKGITGEGSAFGHFGTRWLPDVTTYGAYVRASGRFVRDDWEGQIMVFDPVTVASALGAVNKPTSKALDVARDSMRNTVASGEFDFRSLVLRAIHDDFEGYWLRCAGFALGQTFGTLAAAQKALKAALRLCVDAIGAAESAIADWEMSLDQSADSRSKLRSVIFECAYGDDLGRLAHFRDVEKSLTSANPDFVACMRSVVDLLMRRYAFQIAARWWEAEFVKRALRFRERADRIEIWRLAACITPCVVGTPDRLANVFVRWTRSGAKTMWGEADFVIVDEAGQSSCDRTAGVFGYAPRALVVGDTLQISPVEGEDAPMWGPALAKRNDVFDADSLERGLLVGVVTDLVVVCEYGKPDVVEGSVMRAASAASYAHSREPLVPMKGGWLLEHFRCRPKIIAFSNAGWYHGLLQSRRPDVDFPYPEFTHVDVRDDALPVSSRRNLVEANRAAQWLMRERLQILVASNEPTLDRAIAIVTPFREQAIAMRQTLKRLLGPEGDLITCGTLHSLQGAERSIILMLTAYSGSYFLGDSELTYFMDRQGTLLNVAVSRARDSFIVIGDRRVFDRARRGTPTAALGNCFTRPSS